MKTFPMTHFRFETKYPESSTKVQLGRSWVFTAKPDAPDQRVFVLYFTGMKYYVATNNVLDLMTNKEINNLGVLETFYQSVLTWDKFFLKHPLYGKLVVMFNKPLAIPTGVANGLGTVDDFSIELLEIPT